MSLHVTTTGTHRASATANHGALVAEQKVVQSKVDTTARVMPGAYVASDVTIESGVTVGPNAVLMGLEGDKAAATILKDASIGANATILPGVVVGSAARVAPGAVVTRSVPPLAIVEGNPARVIAYVDAHTEHRRLQLSVEDSIQIQPTQVPGVTLHTLTLASDVRGSLSAAEVGRDVPFVVKRYFLVFDVPNSETRGEHAHLSCEQFLVAVRGSIRVVADDGRVRQEFVLDRPDRGLYLPPMVWGIQYCYTPDALLLVLASEKYDSEDYIRQYDEFVRRRWRD